MDLGRSIRIYLDSGEVSGIKHVELVNWTGQAIWCPRSRIANLNSWSTEANRPGVYFLIGDEQVTSREAYIGEAEDVLVRIAQHLKEEYWQEVIIVTSKDQNLTKSHVKYLEARLIEKARSAGRFQVRNQQDPGLAGLPRPDRDAMEEFLLNVPLMEEERQGAGALPES